MALPNPPQSQSCKRVRRLSFAYLSHILEGHCQTVAVVVRASGRPHRPFFLQTPWAVQSLLLPYSLALPDYFERAMMGL